MTGGGRPSNLDAGWFVQPTVFAEVDNNSTIAQEEIFGSVLSVIRYTDTDDAIRIANDSDCGKVNLAAYPGFLTGGSVAVYADRDTTPVPATVKPDGSFTSGPITLNNDDYWYSGRHYVAVSLSNGINVDTVVYQVAS